MFLYKMAVPAVEALGLNNTEAALTGYTFWNFSDLAGIFITLSLGVLVCLGGLKSGAFHWEPPQWLTLEGVGKLVIRELAFFWREAVEFYYFACQGMANGFKNLASFLARGR